MRNRLIGAALALALAGAGLAADASSATAQEKSQQNAADEAAVKGDLDAAKKAGDPGKLDAAEKKLEQAAESARDKQSAGAPVQVSPRYSDFDEAQLRAIYDSVEGEQATHHAADVGPLDVGAVLPPAVELHTLPGVVTTRIAGTSTFRYVLSGNRVAIVEPTERIVVGVLSH